MGPTRSGGPRAALRCEHAPGNCRPSLSLAAPFFITPRPGARQASFAEPLERRPAVTRSKLGLKNGAIVAALSHLKAPILRDAGTRAFPPRVLPGCARLRAPPSARKIQIGRVTKFTKIGKTPPRSPTSPCPITARLRQRRKASSLTVMAPATATSRRPRRRVRAKIIKWKLSGCAVAVTPVSGPKHGAITPFL